MTPDKMSSSGSGPVSWEATPNPATLRFSYGRRFDIEAIDCPTPADAERSPLASKIFGFPWTAAVYVGPDFITVTKHDWVDWSVLANPLAGMIEEHLAHDEPLVAEVVEGTSTDPSSSEPHPDDTPVVRQIKEILNREIRPAVAMDGGDIIFNRYEDQVVYLHMRGACAGCPSSAATLKQGIEVRLMEAVPEIREVVAV